MSALTLKRLGAALMFSAALTLFIAGEPTFDEQLEAAEETLSEALASRAFHVDPWEVYEAMHNNRMKLILLDVRETGDFNLFHLRGARRIAPEALEAVYPLKATAVVLISNDEALAERAWRRLYLKGQKNAYIMEGGINLWLSIFRPELCAAFGGDPESWLLDTLGSSPCRAYGLHPHLNAAAQRDPASMDGALRHHFEEAGGDRTPWAAPPQLHGEAAHARHFEAKIKLIGAVAKKAGGCG